MNRAAAGSRAGLDERQRAAVEAPPGPLLVLAGAGSGKTRVLTERAALLARRDLAPEQVLVITFTNRAADELRTRLATRLGETGAARMTVGTFHAVCHRMLRRHARRAGRTPAFSVYDQSASHRLIARALAELDAAADLPRAAGGAADRDRRGRGCSARPTTASSRRSERARCRGARLGALRAGARALRRARLRRAARARRAAARAARPAGRLPAAVAGGARRRVPGHQPGPGRVGATAVRRAPQPDRRRRRRPVDLWLAGSRRDGDPGVRAPLPGRPG